MSMNSMNEYGRPDHLSEEAFNCLKLPDDERIEKLKSPLWLAYPRAREIHAMLKELLTNPKNLRMPNALVCGPSNAGKSVLVERFVEKHKAENQESRLPIMMIQAPPGPDLKDLYSLCLQKLHVPQPPKSNARELRGQFIRVLGNLGTRMLVVDEIHHLTAGAAHKQTEFLNNLKFLSNELKIAIVCIGTEKALHVFQAENQIGNRFEPLPVCPWKEGPEYRSLLANFELETPLRHPSDLMGDMLAAKLLFMSDGLIGELATLLRRAAKKAIRSGQEMIDSKLLDSLGWVLPRNRRDDAIRAMK